MVLLDRGHSVNNVATTRSQEKNQFDSQEAGNTSDCSWYLHLYCGVRATTVPPPAEHKRFLETAKFRTLNERLLVNETEQAYSSDGSLVAKNGLKKGQVAAENGAWLKKNGLKKACYTGSFSS